MRQPLSILWFRNDLRLDDNPALRAAAAAGAAVLPLYIWSPEEEGKWAPGGASRWWLHQSLIALDESLGKRGSRLVLRRGPALHTLTALLGETGARAVFWNQRWEPHLRGRDTHIVAALREQGVRVDDFNGGLLFDPADLRTKSRQPYQVFTPFWNACLEKPEPLEPLAIPSQLAAPARWPESLPLEAFTLQPRFDWAGGLRQSWTPGEGGAQSRLRRFLKHIVAGYHDSRDHPAEDGTSRLSPHLHFGELSPRRLWREVRRAQALRAANGKGGWTEGPEGYLRQLGWREFAHHLLHHFPHTPQEPLRENFREFPWLDGSKTLEAWRKGQTGYPFIDAAMRQLWATGWMHNRARMAVGSFLVKDLRVHWLEGAKWFWDTLVDADLANNTLGWQWVAGCGADAAPYFRIFNPVTQGEKFDPAGDYVRRWVPELAKLPAKWIHKPWQAPEMVLAAAAVRLGRTYPAPVVDHAAARREALAAFESIRRSG